ncbi:MAG TPA: ATP-binding cassette domain-containing protein [Gemmataceae bacterium]|jgi:ABC-2 type transport system ATP-binding protein|nr:ATP-binding cassette domain-containing protein [Gemmataceae bacterium]
MLLETEALTKNYGKFTALNQLQLTVRQGEVFGLLGPNGSGKTTALRLLLGFLRPTSGSAQIDGHDCWHDSAAVRQKVAYLPGELRLYENMTGRQLVNFLCKLRRHAIGQDADLLARQLEIDLDRKLANLSSGMKRKVALLQVLVSKVPLLILDEPTNALDPTMREELLEQIKEARQQGQTVLFSSHVLSEVEAVCDRVAVLRAGRLVHLQEMSELRAGRLVQARFLKLPEQTSWPQGLQEYSRRGNTITWEYAGPLSPLCTWLGEQEIAELQLEPLGLKGIYHRYHGASE